jgi:hypothetical protein
MENERTLRKKLLGGRKFGWEEKRERCSFGYREKETNELKKKGVGS